MSEIFTIDARGLACPQPVLMTKKALDEGIKPLLKVIVDNDAAEQNVSRFATSRGCEVKVLRSAAGDGEIIISSSGVAPGLDQPEAMPVCNVAQSAEQAKIVVYIAADCMGRGDDELGAKLMRGFLRTWIDASSLPWRVIFINSGVRLATVDEEAVEAVLMLEDKGVEILACGTCLQHFGLEAQLKVGKVTNMFEVVETLRSATKVVSPD